jgi:DNA-binding NtrC family response regulator
MAKEILLINDNKDEFEIFKEALYSVDKTVRFRQVKNSKEAAEFLRLRSPEYIFIDFDTHAIKDPGFFSELRKLSTHKKSKVILYSNELNEEEMGQYSGDSTSFQFFKKPRLINVLARKLEDILNDR